MQLGIGELKGAQLVKLFEKGFSIISFKDRIVHDLNDKGDPTEHL